MKGISIRQFGIVISLWLVMVVLPPIQAQPPFPIIFDEGEPGEHQILLTNLSMNTVEVNIGEIVPTENPGEFMWIHPTNPTQDGPVDSLDAILTTRNRRGRVVTRQILDVDVLNVAPTATFTVETTLFDDIMVATLSLSDPFDPSPIDTADGFTYSFDCDDRDSIFDAEQIENSTYNCIYLFSDTYVVRGRIYDKDGGFTEIPFELDIDIPVYGVTVFPNSLSIMESASSDYQVGLLSVPTQTVTLSAIPDHQCDLGAGASNPVHLTFNTDNSLTPQTISVIAVDDAIVEGTHRCTILHVTNSNDTNYHLLDVPNTIVNITDNDVATIQIADATASEGQSLNFDISMSNPVGRPITVSILTQDGSAQANSDYTSINSSVTFNPLETNRIISIETLTDLLIEGDENLLLNISLDVLSDDVFVADGQGAGIINDLSCTLDNRDPRAHLTSSGIYVDYTYRIATATITNHAELCAYEIGMASYEVFGDSSLSEQAVFDWQPSDPPHMVADINSYVGGATNAIIVPPQSSRELRVMMPNCKTQVDVFYDASEQDLLYGFNADDTADLNQVPLILPYFLSNDFGPHGRRYNDTQSQRLVAYFTTAEDFCISSTVVTALDSDVPEAENVPLTEETSTPLPTPGEVAPEETVEPIADVENTDVLPQETIIPTDIAETPIPTETTLEESIDNETQPEINHDCTEPFDEIPDDCQTQETILPISVISGTEVSDSEGESNE